MEKKADLVVNSTIKDWGSEKNSKTLNLKFMKGQTTPTLS
jgi:hypothetical protein